jgi:hypothetical protein
MTKQFWFQAANEENTFHIPFIWIKTMKQRVVMETSNQLGGNVVCAIIPQIGGWILKMVGSYQIQLHS